MVLEQVEVEQLEEDILQNDDSCLPPLAEHLAQERSFLTDNPQVADSPVEQEHQDQAEQQEDGGDDDHPGDDVISLTRGWAVLRSLTVKLSLIVLE